MSARKKGCFVTSKNMDICEQKEHGIFEKICAQYKAFEERYDMTLLAKGWKKDLLHKLLARLPFFPNDFAVPRKEIPENLDFLFFRFDLGDRQTIRFLRAAKRKNPGCKIIVEVPTYPLQWGKLKWYTKVTKPKHEYCERHLKDCADIAVVYDGRKTLFGLDTISISNGIDLNKTGLRKIPQKDSGDISVISVSSMSYGHGVDRMVKGIGEYYKNGGKRNIIFHVVGSGATLNLCKELTEQYKVKDYVIFHGYKTGSELDAIEDQCDIGVDMLGGHRTEGANFSSTLKSREYWAKGMPIISSARYSDEVDEISDYMLKCPADETAIDIEKVVCFFDTVFHNGDYQSKMTVAEEIRSFCLNHYSISKILSSVCDYIDN